MYGINLASYRTSDIYEVEMNGKIMTRVASGFGEAIANENYVHFNFETISEKEKIVTAMLKPFQKEGSITARVKKLT